MYKSDTKIRVRYAETDQMGVVHHAQYYVYFEAAREDFIEGTGLKYVEMEDMGVMMPIVETHCKYHQGAKYGDEIIVETTLLKLTPVKVSLGYKVFRESDGQLLANGSTMQTFVDKNTFRIVNLKKKYPMLWDKLFGYLIP